MTVQKLLQALTRELATQQRPVIPADTALDVPCTDVVYDSRKAGRGTVFVALPGQKADGVSFAPQALAAGAVAVVAERPAPDSVEAAVKPARWIVVENA